MATPHVAAVAALLHDLGVKDPEQIRTILRLTATDLSAPGFDNASGYGLLNATKALRLAQRWPVPGDANTDGKVDGADLAIWQERYDPLGLRDNNTFAMGDFNGDGKVDGGDLALWQQNYAPLGINVSALIGDDPIPLFGDGGRALPTPEPATLGLMSISLIMGAAARRMKAKRRAVRGRPPDRLPPDAPPPTVSPRRTC
jgi:hypothetical protein